MGLSLVATIPQKGIKVLDALPYRLIRGDDENYIIRHLLQPRQFYARTKFGILVIPPPRCCNQRVLRNRTLSYHQRRREGIFKIDLTATMFLRVAIRIPIIVKTKCYGRVEEKRSHAACGLVVPAVSGQIKPLIRLFQNAANAILNTRYSRKSISAEIDITFRDELFHFHNCYYVIHHRKIQWTGQPAQPAGMKQLHVITMPPIRKALNNLQNAVNSLPRQFKPRPIVLESLENRLKRKEPRWQTELK